LTAIVECAVQIAAYSTIQIKIEHKLIEPATNPVPIDDCKNRT